MKVTLTAKKTLLVEAQDSKVEYKFEYQAIKNRAKEVFEPVIELLGSSRYVHNLFEKLYLNYIRTKDELQLYKDFVNFKWAVKEAIDRFDLFKEVKQLEIVQKKKNAIFFNKDDLLDILYTSFYLKFYALFYATKLKPSQEFHGKIFSNLSQALAKKNILSKLYKLIQVKVFASASSDKAFWQYLKFVSGDSPDTVCLDIYVRMLENVLPVLDADKNPVTYIVVYASRNVDYIFVSAYTDVFFYESMFFYDMTETYQTKSEDLLPGIVLKSMVEKVITPLVSKVYNLNVDLIKNIVEVNPLTRIIAIPFFSRLVNIPISVFKELNVYYTYIISLYVAYLLKFFKLDNLSKFLVYTINRVYIKKHARFSKKQLNELAMFIPVRVVQNYTIYNKLLQRLASSLNNIIFLSLNRKESISDWDSKSVVAELFIFYKNLLSGKFNSIFKKLRERNLNCFEVAI